MGKNGKKGEIMIDKITITIRCPICGNNKNEDKIPDAGFKDRQLILTACEFCKNNLNEINKDMVVNLAETGNPYAVGLCRTLLNIKVQTRGPQCLHRGLRNKEIRAIVLELRKDGAAGREVLQTIKDKWPDDPTMWVSKSALYRFLESARKGKLKDFGIN